MNVLISRRVKYTGKIFEPGTILDLPKDKAWRLINQCWAEYRAREKGLGFLK